MSTRRLTTARALVGFLANQHVERDGKRRRFFAGTFGIFSHGNVAGIDRTLQEVRPASLTSWRATSRRWSTRPPPVETWGTNGSQAKARRSAR